MFGVILFGLILFGTVYTSWSLMPVSFPRLGKILPIISSNTFFSSLSLCVFFSSFPSLPSLLLIFSFSFLYNVSVSAYFFPESESEVAQSCPTLCDPMDCSLSGSSVHWIFQARVLEGIAISFSRGSSWPRNWTRVSYITGRRFTVWATRKISWPLYVLPILYAPSLFPFCCFI